MAFLNIFINWTFQRKPNLGKVTLKGKKEKVALAESYLLVCLCLSSEERESWIRAKYEQKLFVAPLPPPTPGEGPDITLSGRLLLAVMEHNLPKLLLLLAHCTKEDINAPLSLSVSSRAFLALRLPGSALHAACQQADVVMTQLLLWVGFTIHCYSQNTVNV